MPEITFQSLLRNSEIGANSYVLQFGTTRILVDAGSHPREEGRATTPDLDLLATKPVEAVIISHSHLDHVGSLPLVQRRCPKAEVLMTEPTSELVEAMLHNSINVMQARKEQAGIAEYPLFSHPEVDRLSRGWGLRANERPFRIGGDEVRTTFYDAGHILGSVGILFEYEGKRIFYTGDVHFEDQTLMRKASFPTDPVDVLIMETTRGAAERDPAYSREAESRKLATTITETIQRGGSVLLPSFALGKTQEMLFLLHELKNRGLLPPVPPIRIGGLATRMTQITDRFSDKSCRRHSGVKLMRMKDLVEPLPRNRHVGGKSHLNYAPGRIYVLSSGMMTENTTSNDFAFQFIDNPKNSLVFVGYADPASPAGLIKRTAPGEKVILNPANAGIPLRCAVQSLDFSGHAPRPLLLDYAVKVHPRKIVLVHGDLAAMEWFREALREKLPETEVIIAPPSEVLTLAET
jgi:Cft2 family RNA processing exonuclease